jgi:phosphoglycerate dehydrogenase-like enzyme
MRLLVGARISAEKQEALQRAAPSMQLLMAEGRDEVMAAIGDVEAYTPGAWDENIFAAGGNLRWVHFRSAGVDREIFPSLAASEVAVTNSAGVFAIPMAEHAMALMLALARGLHICARPAGNGPWRTAQRTLKGCLFELSGATLGIVGYGHVGREIAKRAKAFGMRVLALRRRVAEEAEGVDGVYGPDGLDDLLRRADFVAVTCALTPATRGIIGSHELAIMKDTACIVNVARGAIIDEPALIDALRDGQLRYAGLDVASTEPLPADSPLWQLDNVVVTPHVSGLSPETPRRQFDLFLENVRRYADGRPLLNVVDKKAGY